MHVGQKIKIKRKKAGLTQGELAKQLGLKSRVSVSEYERREHMSFRILKRVAKELNVDWLYFIIDDYEQLKEISHGDLMKKYISVLEQNIELQQKINALENRNRGV